MPRLGKLLTFKLVHQNLSRMSAAAPRDQTRVFNRSSTLKKIADDTLKAIESGSYAITDSQLPTETFDLRANAENLKARTLYYGPDSVPSSWAQSRSEEPRIAATTKIWAVETSTLETARWLVDKCSSQTDQPLVDGTTTEEQEPRACTVGVLNFASAKNPGGGFLRGTQAQEESIARSSTLYASLISPIGQQFYTYNHSIIKGGNDGYYSHAMIYSPSVLVFRNDTGDWVRPYEINILTSPAVNAGVVREKRQQALNRGEDVDSVPDMEAKIRAVMKERMARLLYLFELHGVRNLVLGSFGTGVFKNHVDMVVELWAELLLGENARFGRSFDRIAFGVIGHGTYLKFAERFGTEAA